MTKAEALPVLYGLNNGFTGADYKGRKIVGFIIAAIDANDVVINLIAKRYLKNRDLTDYESFVNNDFINVGIHVIVESNSITDHDGYAFVVEPWNDPQ